MVKHQFMEVIATAKTVFNTSSDHHSATYYHEATKRFFFSRGQAIDGVE